MAIWLISKRSADPSWYMQIGQIGCIFIDEYREVIGGPVVGWDVTWRESSESVYGEGICLRPTNHTFSLTDEGLEQAKKAGIEFANQLVREALIQLKTNSLWLSD